MLRKGMDTLKRKLKNSKSPLKTQNMTIEQRVLSGEYDYNQEVHSVHSDTSEGKLVDQMRTLYESEKTDSGDLSKNSRVQSIVNKIESPTRKDSNENKVVFRVCCGKNDKQDSYIILSCEHVYHVSCLVETHFQDLYKYPVIDEEYFASRKCLTCSKKLQTEELMFLHSKFLSSSKDKMDNHKESIALLEDKLKHIKDELRACYEYKHKLEIEREKSKEIVATLQTLI